MLTMDEVLRMTPLPRGTMHSLAARVALNTPLTLRSMTLSKASSVYSMKEVLSETPALFTRMSTQPYWTVALRKAFRTDSRSDRSGLMPAMVELGYFSLSCATALSAEAWELAVRITVAPSFKNASAVAKPIPRLPPVMMATFSFSFI